MWQVIGIIFIGIVNAFIFGFKIIPVEQRRLIDLNIYIASVCI